ncbi:MAG: peptidoglycan bridge formation glycyltransferase FemA/FemB family protein [Clostridia bacterium]|nr:peptidoglycan bridge formation glycyltransferase FemA/FemB family protein [Clostridia bacterium]
MIGNLKKCSAIHTGFTEKMKDTIQPRYQMGIKKCHNIESYITKDARKSKNAAIRKHVKVERYGIEKIDEFARIMHMTEERKNILLRDKDYFYRLMEVYKDEAFLFLCSVDPNERYNEVKESIGNLMNQIKNENLSQKQRQLLTIDLKNMKDEIVSLENVAYKYKQETFVAGALMVGFGNTVEMLYAGMNGDFKSFSPQYLSHYIRFKYLFDMDYAYANMGGVEGCLNDGLSKYKSKFNAVVREYIGEFDLPVNKFLYRLYNTLYKVYKRLAKH